MQHKISLILCIAILVAVLCLFIPVGHGPVKYRPFNAALSAINKVALTQGLIKFNTEHATTSLLQLNELCVIQNIPIILSEGTALGAVRDGKLIPWDDDIDIMIEASHKEKFISHVIPQMKDFWIAKVWNKGNFITICKSSLAIDIEFIEIGVKCSCTIKGCIPCPVEDILNSLTLVNLRDVPFKAWGPTFLETVYGPTWQTPMHRSNKNARVKGK